MESMYGNKKAMAGKQVGKRTHTNGDDYKEASV